MASLESCQQSFKQKLVSLAVGSGSPPHNTYPNLVISRDFMVCLGWTCADKKRLVKMSI